MTLVLFTTMADDEANNRPTKRPKEDNTAGISPAQQQYATMANNFLLSSTTAVAQPPSPPVMLPLHTAPQFNAVPGISSSTYSQLAHQILLGLVVEETSLAAAAPIQGEQFAELAPGANQMPYDYVSELMQSSSNVFSSPAVASNPPRYHIGQVGMQQQAPATAPSPTPPPISLSTAAMQQANTPTPPPSRNFEGDIMFPFTQGSIEEDYSMSEYQNYLRKQICYVIISDKPQNQGRTQGRNKALVKGQVGIVCRYCAHLPHAARNRGSSYFPAQIERIYQAAQNMSHNHFMDSCPSIPAHVRKRLTDLKQQKTFASGTAKSCWRDHAKRMGVREGEKGLEMS